MIWQHFSIPETGLCSDLLHCCCEVKEHDVCWMFLSFINSLRLDFTHSQSQLAAFNRQSAVKAVSGWLTKTAAA